ncbi:mannitol dehydrogenase family protein [Catenuloplanes atrovinosus]|uniref:Mannitol-1-phosphate 5-dehydrogenase n=1 Tax=Catenuloplanes atrovinosus TaxID=137266 RepID=A0AAE3YY46_9ACTN|nr:mannitol dehydrogenase family protein [Catenuloplanes atrovinosus]MDR7280359.1 fructuronate reductase [Catenuloplanes atrovinosus]
MTSTVGVARLGIGAIASLPIESRPLVRPDEIRSGIVHLGLGAFHRAHQAVYTEEAISAGGGDWGIVGVAPRSTGVFDRLRAQDNLFSVTTLGAHTSRTRVIGALSEVRHAASDPAAIVALLADPRIRVVTLTVTEKAYQLDPVTGELLADEEVAADLTTDRPPRTVPGLLIRGLLARAAADAGPITLLSCDNLPSNGRRTHGLVAAGLAFAAAGDAASWVDRNVTFPNSMVDRIVPASTPETLATAAAALGVEDQAAVAAEPYIQWVIEDRFPGGRPAWERAGAIMTDDAGQWERLKLRTLNGVHSALAYLGALAGKETIAESLALPGMEATLRRLIAEDIAESFEPPDGVSITGYGDEVLARFANPVILHRTHQVAMDGTQKLPQRILHTILDRRAAGGDARWATLVVAAWMRFAQGAADDGTALPLNDPLADRIRTVLADTPSEPAAVVDALLHIDSVFPAALVADDEVRASITAWLTDLTRHGAVATVEAAGR